MNRKQKPGLHLSERLSCWLIYPFLFAIYPILFLLSYNLDQVTPNQAIRSLLIMLGLTAVLLPILKLITLNWYKAGLLVSLYMLIFLGYGHLVRTLEEPVRDTINFVNLNKILVSIAAVIFILGSWTIWRLIKPEKVEAITNFLNLFAIIITVIPLFSIVFHEIQQGSVRAMSPSETTTMSTKSIKPDIYYIILDGYTRGDIIEEIFDSNNDEFLNYLTDQGFFVADQSYSNYAQTSLSISSVLNLDYVNHLETDIGANSGDRTPMINLIQDSQVINLLRESDYTLVGIGSGWHYTDFKKIADVYLPPERNINEFEAMVLTNSMVGTLYGATLNYELKRQQVHFVFNSLVAAVPIEGPKFVFAHVISPHIPHVFGPDGTPIQPKPEDALQEFFMDAGTRDQYITGYAGELNYLNHLLQKTIDEILANSETSPIIIIQGDHGSRAYLDWSSAENTCMHERLAIFNAYYFPDQPAELYDEITPINSFRVLFNNYLGGNFELITDERSYFSLWDKPYGFYDVTDQLEQPCGE